MHLSYTIVLTEAQLLPGDHRAFATLTIHPPDLPPAQMNNVQSGIIGETMRKEHRAREKWVAQYSQQFGMPVEIEFVFEVR